LHSTPHGRSLAWPGGVVMPYKQKIADVERAIEEVLDAIAAIRARGNVTSTEPLLVKLARLKAERLRLMEHQRSLEK
jgi:hypothetical protein